MASSKSLDEVFDAWVCRPLGAQVAKVVLKTSLTANHVSFAVGFFGVLSGIFFAFPTPFPLVGASLLFLMMVLDCTDGIVARQKGGGGWRGRMIDGLADTVTALSIHSGMVAYFSFRGLELGGLRLHPVAIFLLTFFVGASMAWHSAAVDNVKQRLKNDSIDDDFEACQHEVATWWDRLLYSFLRTYLVRMRRATGSRRPGGYTCFRRIQWVGPTHHHLVVVVSGALVPWFPNAYLFYFAFAGVVANVYLLAVLAISPSAAASGQLHEV